MDEKKEVIGEATEETKAAEAPKKKKNGLARHIAFALALVIIIGGVGASIGMNVMLQDQMNQQYAKVSQFIDDERARQAKEAEQESTYQEDGYKVMEQYEIRSTTHISDAYLKGDPSGLSEEDKETYDLAAEVLDEVVKDNMSDYEKELAIYNWMVDNIGHGSGHVISMPGQNSESYTPHEVLKNHSAVCVGYATTFRLLANMVGMEVHIVHNDYHSWDMVKLDDGEWYQLDIYSDVSGARYRNFNMTDELARNGHEWDESALPEAKGTKYSYAVQNAKQVKDLFEIPAKVKKALDDKKDSLFFKFPKKLSDDELALADQMMNLLMQAMYSQPSGISMDLSAMWVPDGADSYVLAIYVNDYSGGESSLGDAVPEKVTEMTNKINEIFGTELMDPNAGMEGVDPLAVDASNVMTVVDENGVETTWRVDDEGNKLEQIGGADGPTETFTVTEETVAVPVD